MRILPVAALLALALPASAAERIAPPVDDLDVRSFELLERLEQVREHIFRAKLRLEELERDVLGERAEAWAARLVVKHRNELGRAYRLTTATFLLDGAPLFLHVDASGAIGETVLYDRAIVTGLHRFTVQYRLRGNGGVLPYLDGLALELRRSGDVEVSPSKVREVTAVLRERPDLTLEFQDRPEIAFEIATYDLAKRRE